MALYRLLRATSSWLVPAFAIIACAEPAQPAQPPRNQGDTRAEGYIDRVCNTLCQKSVQCDPKWDGALCQKNCRERGSPARAFWREDYQKATLACLDAVACDVMKTGDVTDKKCFSETRPEPSELAKRYCEVSLEKERTCSGQAPDMPACLRAWGMINDAALKTMVECQDRACGEATPCAKAAVGFDKPKAP